MKNIILPISILFIFLIERNFAQFGSGDDDYSGDVDIDVPTSSGSSSVQMVEIAIAISNSIQLDDVLSNLKNSINSMQSILEETYHDTRIALLISGARQKAFLDFTSDGEDLGSFLHTVTLNEIGTKEFYFESLLDLTIHKLSWTDGSKRSVILIGDASNEKIIKSKEKIAELEEWGDLLREKSIKAYAMKVESSKDDVFFSHMAYHTGGFYSPTASLENILDSILAPIHREHGINQLKQFQNAIEVAAEKKGVVDKMVNDLGRKPMKLVDMDIYTLKIESNISFRFATTVVTSHIANRATIAQEAFFHVTLPKKAFISNFSMEIDGVEYPGQVKEKEQARQQYEKAKSRGESASQVIAVPRNTNSFKVVVNVAAKSKVEFRLTYLELLKRTLGEYEHVIHIDPGQIVRDLEVKVNINESKDLSFVRVPPLRNDLITNDEEEGALASITRPSPREAVILYKPSWQDQIKDTKQGVQGQFIVQYDVNRSDSSGEIQILDGYFLHFIAPPNLKPAKKRVLFVLDKSGSMGGSRIRQLRLAMLSILDQLREGDLFNMIKFSTNFEDYQQHMQEVSKSNIADAKKWVKKLDASGGTNINSALLGAIDKLKSLERYEDKETFDLSMIIFLTDGEPTSGITDKQNIISNVKGANTNKCTIFSLSFGSATDYPFLQQIALQNRGFARRIYEDSDAHLQLQGFFDEIASPVMSNVNITYLNEDAILSDVTSTSVSTFFDGSEMIVAGHLKQNPNYDKLVAQVEGNGLNGMENFTHTCYILPRPFPEIPNFEDSFETNGIFRKIWAYLTIDRLLKESMSTSNESEINTLKEKALELSLKYSFVTKVTSMVVTKPDKTVDSEELKDSDEAPKRSAYFPSTIKRKSYSSYAARRNSAPRAHAYKVNQVPNIGGANLMMFHVTTTTASPTTRHMQSLSFPGSRGRGGGFGVLHDPIAYADQDPHFVISVVGSALPVCFDVMGLEGEMYQLFVDPILDLTVNGYIIGPGKKAKDSKHGKTYFGKIGIVKSKTKLIITQSHIKIGSKTHLWKPQYIFESSDLFMEVLSKDKLRVVLNEGVTFVIMRHTGRRVTGFAKFLGIYLEESKGFTDEVHGLIGQFESLLVNIEKSSELDDGKATAILSFPEEERSSIQVQLGLRKDMYHITKIPCWFAHNSGRGLIEGTPDMYKVSNILQSGPTYEMKNRIIWF